MAHTHKGTCQVCGRTQAVKQDGTIAKHGYTVEYGFFNGTCAGSGQKPLQQDRSVLDSLVTSWIEQGNKLKATSIDSIKKVPAFVFRGNYRTQELLTEAEYNDLPKSGSERFVTFKDIAGRELFKIQRNGDLLLQHCEDMKELASKIHGTELFPVKTTVKHSESFECLKKAYAFANEQKAKGMKVRVCRGWHMGQRHTVHWQAAK